MKYIFMFAFGVCLVCSMVISVASVSLKERQEANQLLKMKRSVLQASGIMAAGEKVERKEVEQLFNQFEPKVINLETGTYAEEVDATIFEQEDAVYGMAPANAAGIADLPDKIKIYHVMEDGKVSMLVLPIWGKGLWSTLYGYLALDADTNTVKGLTYYSHGETPGLGGEVDNPKWKAKWVGREVYDDDWDVAIRLIKGSAGPPEEAPHQVDGLSGATLTSRGVTNMMHFWLGESGYGPYLEQFRKGT